MQRRTRHRILTDLGAPGAALNQKLTAWWALDFPGFLGEVCKAFKREIPVRQRDDWEGWLAEQRGEHAQRTAEIVRLETQLNAQVYTLFNLSLAEIKIIEESTKYRYGEVNRLLEPRWSVWMKHSIPSRRSATRWPPLL